MRRGTAHIVILLMLTLAGCMNFLPMPTSSKPRPDFIQEAITKQDWAQVYMLLQPALVSSNLMDRYRATELIRIHPDIVDAADKSFSITSLENSHRINAEISPTVQWKHLSMYRRTIATPEMYSKALGNYRAVFGVDVARIQAELNQNIYELTQVNDISDNKLAKELHDALGLHKFTPEWPTNELQQILLPGKTLRTDTLALLGPPSGRFDLNTTLTWPLRLENDKYRVLPAFERNPDGVTHSLVVAFDKNHILTDQKIIKVIR